ncbi:fructosamine kinase family protein [Pseudenhygromyxa sp. WMMC2535]|uniref:fructosamine kinase family protein n=1 Tax=Pseudenhygromyxa sp. WMMC2535 TaxID=2712867 RepID=UPI0015523A33|nr:fructosamine kinase family protein [Pseudenhygromyxa sp. WMMC2535]NVB42246.1 fructosamine kinase family protein [Pseudenhygromyxa sp. WMMC2535]
MNLDARLAGPLTATLGAGVARARAIAGGSINAAWAVTLSDGREVFVKARSSSGAPAEMFAAEVHGLEWLRAAISELGSAFGDVQLRVPEVLACDPRGRFLVLELLEPGPAKRDFDERLGRGLAALHRSGAALPGFGLEQDNFIGSLEQRNAPAAAGEDWPSFYRERRLAPLVALAAEQGLVDARLRRAFELLYARLEDRCGPPEPPARLHGDLWAGNLHRDAQGLPALIDPAVYAGHREVDLAMMRLFGGFSPRVFAAYEEAYPLSPGAEARVDLYQLYPLLVHAVLFGASYLDAVVGALARLL